MSIREQYDAFVRSIDRATDREIDEAMAQILREQSERKVLRPATPSCLPHDHRPRVRND